MTREVRPSLYALAAAVIALLLVACGNAAGLLLGGALARQHEFATRLALGASRARIVRQILAENLVVGLLAAAAGFAMAWWARDLLVGAATAAGVPRASEISIGPLDVRDRRHPLGRVHARLRPGHRRRSHTGG